MARQADPASQVQNPKLRPLLQALAPRILKDRDRRIGEENTKTKLINPVLDALGWDVQGDDVEQEFKNKSTEDPVDYALKSEDGPVIVVEAKALGVNLADPKWIGQLMKYASMAGVEWGVLTNGDEYRLYNTTAKVPVDEKVFFQVRISEEQGDKAVMMLPWLSRDCVRGGGLEPAWKRYLGDRQVRTALLGVLKPVNERLIDLVGKKVRALEPNEIGDAIARLGIHIDAPVPPPPTGTSRQARMSGLDAAAKVLADAGKPMNTKEIVQTMLAKGLWKTGGKTPAATIYAAIIGEIAAKGKDARFRKTGRGQFEAVAARQ